MPACAIMDNIAPSHEVMIKELGEESECYSGLYFGTSQSSVLPQLLVFWNMSLCIILIRLLALHNPLVNNRTIAQNKSLSEI